MSFFKRLFKGTDEKIPETKDRTLQNLRVGDFVTYDLADYEVAGKIHYNDGGYTWDAYQLSGNGKTLWLSVELDDELGVGIYEKIRIPGLEPGAKKVTHDGRTYYLDEEGRAYVKSEGRSENVHGKNVDYYDYADDLEEHFLSVEVWGGDVEVSYGYEIEEYEVTILAGS
ncbi:DUF4178 domain-containing protein [Domibacillus epiphyticus]|uniref:DUF4178 domain-containing protein n=1 Tax=Domibacillus epiphyticus TaxID=1714355 RepID=A0A1V2A4N1_9BACI|nr:DUF4178 domain-containing protein [Domibacillus epiphyticus]OMP65953.1 hypothetical protein BTO28_14240 [Domibacillus epiphyticus]